MGQNMASTKRTLIITNLQTEIDKKKRANADKKKFDNIEPVYTVEKLNA